MGTTSIANIDKMPIQRGCLIENYFVKFHFIFL